MSKVVLLKDACYCTDNLACAREWLQSTANFTYDHSDLSRYTLSLQGLIATIDVVQADLKKLIHSVSTA